MPAVSRKSPARRAVRGARAFTNRGGPDVALARLLAAATAGKPEASRKVLAALWRLASVSTRPADMLAHAAAMGDVHRTEMAEQGERLPLTRSRRAS